LAKRKYPLYSIGQIFTVNGIRFRIEAIYECSWWKEDHISFEIEKDGKWQWYKSVDLHKIKKYL